MKCERSLPTDSKCARPAARSPYPQASVSSCTCPIRPDYRQLDQECPSHGADADHSRRYPQVSAEGEVGS